MLHFLHSYLENLIPSRYNLFDILKRRIGRKNVGRKNVLFTKLMLSPKNIYDWLDKLY
jgi:hypothetical protein